MDAETAALPPPADGTRPLLEVRDLRVHYSCRSARLFQRRTGAIQAVDGVSLYIRGGETLGLVGESGCGKTSAARAIAGLLRPASGQVFLEGTELGALRPSDLQAMRRNLQMIFQDPGAALDPRMTVGSAIAEPLEVLARKGPSSLDRPGIRERVGVLLEKVGLPRHIADRYPHELPDGWRPLIGIARALAPNPRLILADEPVSSLDLIVRARILNLFKDLQAESRLSFLFIAHDLAVVRHVSDRVAVMLHGRIVESAPSGDLYRSPLHPYTMALIAAAPRPDPAAGAGRGRPIAPPDMTGPELEHRGCRFRAGCPRRMERCRSEEPALAELAPEHWVACHLHGAQPAS
jgi:oligopeptide transport system ATP-binding protein